MTRIPRIATRPEWETSWVGDCPWTRTRCYGSEDGRFIVESPGSPDLDDGNAVAGVLAQTVPFTIATDPINDVAFSGDLFAASSRNEVVLGRRIGPDISRLDGFSHPFIGGAHGVLAGRPGVFLAPIADRGLLILKVSDEKVNARISSPPEAPFNFYRVVRLGDAESTNAFAAAGRRDGLLALELDDESNPRSAIHHRFGGHDIVDVCSLGDAAVPFAAACVSRDCVLFLSRNVLEENEPVAVRLGDLRENTAYTLLSAGGHLFLLTDENLVVIPRLASRFLDGERLGPELEAGVLRVDAADAYLLRDEVILLLEESSVSEFRIADLVGIGAGDHSQSGAAGNGSIRSESAEEVSCEERRLAVSAVETGSQPSIERTLVTTPAA